MYQRHGAHGLLLAHHQHHFHLGILDLDQVRIFPADDQVILPDGKDGGCHDLFFERVRHDAPDNIAFVDVVVLHALSGPA